MPAQFSGPEPESSSQSSSGGTGNSWGNIYMFISILMMGTGTIPNPGAPLPAGRGFNSNNTAQMRPVFNMLNHNHQAGSMHPPPLPQQRVHAEASGHQAGSMHPPPPPQQRVHAEASGRFYGKSLPSTYTYFPTMDVAD